MAVEVTLRSEEFQPDVWVLNPGFQCKEDRSPQLPVVKKKPVVIVAE